MRLLRPAAALCVAFAGTLAAQNPPADTSRPQTATPTIPAKWDVSARRATATDVQFETSTGTWMSVDVSPDGKTLVFDMLGDLYVMPISGGQATLLLGGPAYEMQPRFSPDGDRIAFTSDRDGLMNVWTMDVSGKDLRQVTKEKEREVSNPAWTPDGKYLVARKHFRNTRSLGSGEMWLYHVAGGNGLKLTDRRNWEQNATEPAISPDGRYVYFSEDVAPGGGFQYNRNPHGVIYVIQRLDRQTGKRSTEVSGAGGSLAPQLSPDGKTMAFVRRQGTKSVLFLRDMESGRERPLWDGLDHDQQEVWAIYGTYPGYDWTPDGRRIVIWAQGKLWSVDASAGEPSGGVVLAGATASPRGRATPIPFTARVKQTITEAVRFPQPVAPDSFDVKMLRWVTVSPDQKRVAYTALGKLYVKELPSGAPRRITGDAVNWELYPSWSPDGRTLVYATWNDDSLGAIRTIGLDGRAGRKLTTRMGHYIEPSFSADGRQVVYRRIGGDFTRGTLHSSDRGVYVVPAAGGEPKLVTESGSEPRFNRSGDRIFLSSREGEKAALISVDLLGGDRRVHLTAQNATEFTPSPDERYVAWVERFNAYVAPLPLTGKGVDVSPTTTDFPVRRISRDAGLYLHWSPDSRRVYWALGPELFQRDLSQTFAFETQDTTTLRKDAEGQGVRVGFRAATDRPAGRLALVGATAITMNGAEVIPNATILIEGNRIAAIGPAAQVQVPADARRVDVGGKYIMPGLVDAHAHGTAGGSSGIAPKNNWSYLTNLAFGVTTMHDPSSNTEMVFSSSETIRAGGIVGPRVFSTGTILYGAEGSFKAITTSFDDALMHLRRMKAVGAFSVKSYNQPRRDARQQIVEAARQLGMMVVPEGGSTFAYNLTHVLDGHTTVEHNIPIAPLYDDVLKVIEAGKTAYTPTLIVNYNGLNGEYWFYQHDDVFANARLRRFTPPGMLDARARRREMAADDDYSFLGTSRTAKAMSDRGVLVNMGAHGQLAGLGAHWETWMLQMGGMSNHDALRAATLNGAKSLGLDGELGSLERGKLADLIVLDANPLERIRNTATVRYTVINGRIFEAETMAQYGNPQSVPKPIWMDAGSAAAAATGVQHH